MKYIQKQAEPPELIAWKGQANSDWQPSYATMGGALKRKLKAALMREQGGLCCYCEQRLSAEDSHIEHFQPQSDPAIDPLDYANLLCSCQNQLTRGEPRHCGNLKADWFDPERLVSPLVPSCEERFRYTGDGQIKAENDDDPAAQTTIERLGLNLPKLRAMRRAAIEVFLDNNLEPDEMIQFAAVYLRAGDDGELSPFWTTIAQLFGQAVC